MSYNKQRALGSTVKSSRITSLPMKAIISSFNQNHFSSQPKNLIGFPTHNLSCFSQNSHINKEISNSIKQIILAANKLLLRFIKQNKSTFIQPKLKFTFLTANFCNLGTSSSNLALVRRISALIATAEALPFSFEAVSAFYTKFNSKSLIPRQD